MVEQVQGDMPAVFVDAKWNERKRTIGVGIHPQQGAMLVFEQHDGWVRGVPARRFFIRKSADRDDYVFGQIFVEDPARIDADSSGIDQEGALAIAEFCVRNGVWLTINRVGGW